MIKLINTNTKSVHYFVDNKYAYAYVKRNDLVDLFDARVIVSTEVHKSELLASIFNFILSIIEKTNSEIEIMYNQDVFKVSFKDIQVDLILILYSKHKMDRNIQDSNPSVIIGLYSLYVTGKSLCYHSGDFLMNNKNNQVEILKLIKHGTNSKSIRKWNTVWNNIKREVQLFKKRYL